MVAQSAITETYKDMERLIYKTVYDFKKKYGGDEDEMLSEANLTFLSVYEAYDITRGKFSTLLVTSIWRRLCSVARKRGKLQTRYGTRLDYEGGDEQVLKATIEKPVFDLRHFMAGLNEDACQVLRMVFESPESVVVAVANGKRGKKRAWRSSIRKYLRDMGWSNSQVTAAFVEIGAAL